MLWPLYGRWAAADGRHRGDYVFPVYARNRNQFGQQFYSLPWSYGVSADGARDWQAVFPLYYCSRSPGAHAFHTLLGGGSVDGDGKRGVSWPLLTWWERNADENELWALAPLFHRRAGNAEFKEHALPRYSREKTEDLNRFYSLLYAAQQGPGDDRWKAIIPFTYRRQQGDNHLFATLLGGRRHSADGEAWMIYPLLTCSLSIHCRCRTKQLEAAGRIVVSFRSYGDQGR